VTFDDTSGHLRLRRPGVCALFVQRRQSASIKRASQRPESSLLATGAQSKDPANKSFLYLLLSAVSTSKLRQIYQDGLCFYFREVKSLLKSWVQKP
jgi:hypothetical protein